MKVWEVSSLGSHDDNSVSEGLYSSLAKAKASVDDAVWEQQRPSDDRALFAQVTHGSGYDDSGEWWISFTHYYIQEREVL